MDDEGFPSDATDNDTSFNKAPYLVVDSNALFDNWLLTGDRWAHVVDFAHRGLLHLRVPEVVFEETIRHYKKSTDEIARTLIKSDSCPLGDLLGIDVPDAAEIRRRAVEVSDHYPTTLREKLRRANAEILQIPSIEHHTVLARDLEERQPFDKKGKGYRDTLIWHTILSLCQNLDAADVIAFVTNNTNDFCRDGIFSDKLRDEIGQIDNPPQFIHYNTMHDMLAAMADRLAGLDDRLGAGELSEEQARALRAALAETMPAACEALAEVEVSTNNNDDHYYMSGLDFTAFHVPFEHVPFEGVSVSSIEPALESMAWTFIDRDDTNGSMHFTVSVEANIDLDGTISKSQCPSEDDSVIILDDDWNDHYVRASINHTGTLHFDVMVSGTFDRIVRIDLDYATPDD